jgi:hypothetical protein
MVELSVRRFYLCPVIRFANLNTKQFLDLVEMHEVLDFLLLNCFAR